MVWVYLRINRPRNEVTHSLPFRARLIEMELQLHFPKNLHGMVLKRELKQPEVDWVNYIHDWQKSPLGAVILLRRFLEFRYNNLFYRARASVLRPWIRSMYSYPVIPPGCRFPSRRLLRLAGLQWRYSNVPLPREVK
jgi:hypothetical protein